MTFTLYGQLPSGKNAIQITRTGQRYPNKRFKAWREMASQQLWSQATGRQYVILFTTPMALSVVYTTSDQRVRDISGMVDALFSLLVYTGILKDDGLIRELHWIEESLNRSEPKVVMELRRL